MVRPTLSIVITNHNYADFVEQAITSALAQREIDVEVVVVDDGSTDGSHAIIDRFASRVTVLFTTNDGQGAAINRGFAASSGDVVIFLDADDVLYEDTGMRVLRTMRADPTVARIQYTLDVIDRAGHPTGEKVPAPPKVLFAGDARPRLLTCPDDIVWQPTSGNAFSRSALNAVLPMPEAPYRLCADYYLSALAPLHGNVDMLRSAGGGYRIHGNNAFFAHSESLERLRANLRRTCETHRHLIGESRRLGLTGLPSDPAAVRSVTFTANRLLSYRLDRPHHPIDGDTRLSLIRMGLSSAARRADVPLLRRFAFAGWLLALAVIPRRLVRRFARPFARLA